MTWTLDEQRRMLRDSAQAFFNGRAPVAHLRALRDAADAHGYAPELWSALAEQGYAATLIPESQGGLGLGVAEAALVAEQIGHTLAPTPFFSTGVLAARALASAGSPAQQQAWLPRIAAAEAVMALAVDEGPKHRPDRLATTATRSASGWTLQGEKVLVIDGHVADALIVAAKAAGPGLADDAVALLIVPREAAGVAVERTVMVDAHNAARVRFTGVQVTDDALLGTAETGRATLEALLDVGRAVAAAELLGLADEAFARTLDYLKQRKQFDKLIGEFQALQHRASELFCDLELARAILRQALAEIDAGAPTAPRTVAQAKARVGLSANRAVQEAVQMHGGVGMTDALEIGFFMKRARVLQELFGDANWQLDRLARMGGY